MRKRKSSPISTHAQWQQQQKDRDKLAAGIAQRIHAVYQQAGFEYVRLQDICVEVYQTSMEEAVKESSTSITVQHNRISLHLLELLEQEFDHQVLFTFVFDVDAVPSVKAASAVVFQFV